MNSRQGEPTVQIARRRVNIAFASHRIPFVDGAKIKSVDVHPASKRLVFHEASKERLSSDTRDSPVVWDVPAKLP